ncbi:MAG: hypothetical protein KH290_13605, partial [Roseburia sp.]|nr:hypothetical protein [Roseburia sp.]
VLLIAFIPFLDNTIIPHIILNIYSSYLIYAILDMMHEFQHGKSISLYHEKEMERKMQYHKPITKQKFLKDL